MILNDSLRIDAKSSLAWIVPVCLAAAMSLSSADGRAAEAHEHEEGHSHHSDIEFAFGSVIQIEYEEAGVRVFEANFNLDAVQDQPDGQTRQPGFNNEHALPSQKAQPNAFVGFNVHGPLLYWDNNAFTDAGGASLTIIDAVGSSVISSSTVEDLVDFGSLENIIDQADALGDIHAHLEFVLNDGVPGAYAIVMSLATDQVGVGDSERFAIVFDNSNFEAGVDAINAQLVPLPAAAWLFLGAIGLLGTRVRSRAV